MKRNAFLLLLNLIFSLSTLAGSLKFDLEKETLKNEVLKAKKFDTQEYLKTTSLIKKIEGKAIEGEEYSLEMIKWRVFGSAEFPKENVAIEDVEKVTEQEQFIADLKEYLKILKEREAILLEKSKVVTESNFVESKFEGFSSLKDKSQISHMMTEEMCIKEKEEQVLQKNMDKLVGAIGDIAKNSKEFAIYKASLNAPKKEFKDPKIKNPNPNGTYYRIDFDLEGYAQQGGQQQFFAGAAAATDITIVQSLFTTNDISNPLKPNCTDCNERIDLYAQIALPLKADVKETYYTSHGKKLQDRDVWGTLRLSKSPGENAFFFGGRSKSSALFHQTNGIAGIDWSDKNSRSRVGLTFGQRFQKNDYNTQNYQLGVRYEDSITFNITDSMPVKVSTEQEFGTTLWKATNIDSEFYTGGTYGVYGEHKVKLAIPVQVYGFDMRVVGSGKFEWQANKMTEGLKQNLTLNSDIVDQGNTEITGRVGIEIPILSPSKYVEAER